MKTSGNTILVTGGGSGIGREMARWWHAHGNTVIVAGRTPETLEETTGGQDGFHTMVFDVGDPADIERAAREIVAEFPALNVLVNNAGIMKYEDATAGRDLGDAEATIATNLLGPIRLTDALIDHLKTRADPAIVNVTSGLAFVPLPATPTYSATKAALHSYTVSLRAKLGDAVEVIEVAPPGVQTDLTPGQSTNDMYMPLADFIAETMAQFEGDETPSEVLTGPVEPLRHAERDGTFGKMLAMLNQR
ncbi:SDR family oxidoreductase [Tsuneonella amylolytica]|uniref:SDR family oxidoreductase n=1 Tax=Tsuneonella amylolytica TaxID=2338327 RepID=UPI000EA87ADB